MSNNKIVAEVQRQIAARGVPSKYHVVKGITHYGIYPRRLRGSLQAGDRLV